MNFATLVSLLAFTGSFASATLTWGPCPTPKFVPNFDWTKFSGSWFELAHTSPAPADSFLCTTNTFEPEGDDAVNYTASATSCDKHTENSLTFRSDIHVANSSWLKVPLKSYVHLNYAVVATDYTSWALSEGCLNLYVAHKKLVWLYTRDQDVKMSVLAGLKQKAITMGLVEKATDLVDAVQSGCTTYSC